MHETSDGLREHLREAHQIPADIISKMESLSYEQYHMDTFSSLTNMHGALHRASDLLDQAEHAASQNGRTCTRCHLRPPVVILSAGVRLCAPCGLTPNL